MALTKRNELVKEIMINKRGIKRRNGAPFPQANSVEKLLEVIELAKQGVSTKKDFQEKMNDVHTRQVDYYVNAAVFLGALRIQGETYRLHGRFKNADVKQTLMEFMMENHIIREVITLYFMTKQIPSELEIGRLLNKYGSHLENSTFTRRIKTVQSWSKWILNKK